MSEMRNDCCWCGKDTSEGPVTILSVKFNEKGKSLEQEDGYIKEMNLINGKEIWVIVTGKNSPAKQEDKDLLFMCCSRKCVNELKENLEADKDFIESFDLE